MYKKNLLVCAFIVTIGLLTLASGCSKVAEMEQKGTLKVLYNVDEEWFQQIYGNLFSTKHRDVDFEIVSTKPLLTAGTYSKESLKQFVDEHQPDIMVLNSDEYDWLMEAGNLYDMSDLVHGKDFDSEEILPAVLEYLKMKGDGRLYGLAPTFYSTALFYNKDIFDEVGIPYPTNQMTWSEVFHLAERFVGQVDGVYGISQPFQNDPFNFVQTIAKYNGVSMYDVDSNQILLNNSEWRQIFELVVNAYKNNIVFDPNETTKVYNNMQDLIGDKVLNKNDSNKIRVSNLNFQYPNNTKESLKDISFSINQGEKIVIVGENGAGKSTLVKCLLGLYQVRSGMINIGEFDINEIDTISLRGSITAIFQDFMKYHLTAKENIAFGNINSINDETMLTFAASSVGLSSIIDGLPNKYETTLGPTFIGGKELSGGEWQRVALGRAVFSNAPIIILDEPTSALDPLAEVDIYEHFINSFKDKTVIFISHRLGVCLKADKIIVLKDGVLEEQGTHEELIENKDYYNNLFDKQIEWYT
ncbi:extracellular solute-binding protein [Paenibacillus yanchengensis]|uniref:Extracellular solute-binding protein n=1 Tax=Paenibacillus yanchengensis TaxID=2035833 RepID=A0ABW4YF25_9BACL